MEIGFLGRRFLGHRFLGRRFLGRRFLDTPTTSTIVFGNTSPNTKPPYLFSAFQAK